MADEDAKEPEESQDTEETASSDNGSDNGSDNNETNPDTYEKVWTWTFTIGSILFVLFAIEMIFLPQVFLDTYEYNLDSDAARAVIQFLGAVYLAIGLLTWFGRTVTDPYSRLSLLVFYTALTGLTIILAASQGIQEIAGPMVWGTVVINAAFFGLDIWLIMKRPT